MKESTDKTIDPGEQLQVLDSQGIE